MLVLTRKAGEGILIGEDVRVTVLECKDGRIRIGIEAPGDYRIYRQEVYERICSENRQASQWSTENLEALDSVMPRKGEDK